MNIVTYSMIECSNVVLQTEKCFREKKKNRVMGHSPEEEKNYDRE